jgi:serine/threonine protein kinase
MKPSNQPTCPKCAAIIPDEAPGGLCPKCALEGVATVSYTTSGGRKSPPPGIAEIAPHFPELEILELIGAGGMGAVYKARQPQLDRLVALKILSHDLAGDPAFVERFNREARVLARLSHPNIVGIHDFGTAGPYCYLTMEYVDGVNLRQAMQAGRFTPTEALAMVQHLCSALKFAHEEGILHRDIKPENILIDSKGRVKIADFGIAKLVGEDRQHDFTLTLQGSVLGSPHYMAPEQIETPGDVDQRADIYSLGVVLYEMLTGGLPIGRFALPSEKAEMDARIDHIVMRTLEKEREARYQSAGEVRHRGGSSGQEPGTGSGETRPSKCSAGNRPFQRTFRDPHRHQPASCVHRSLLVFDHRSGTRISLPRTPSQAEMRGRWRGRSREPQALTCGLARPEWYSVLRKPWR